MASGTSLLICLLVGAHELAGATSRCTWAEPVNLGIHDEKEVGDYTIGIALAECKAQCDARKHCQAVEYTSFNNNSFEGFCAFKVCSYSGACGATHNEYVYHADTHDCREAPTILFAGVGLLSVVTGAVVFATMHSLVARDCHEAFLGSISATAAIALLGLLPLPISLSPAHCADVYIGTSLQHSAIFPLNLLIAAGSLVGFVVGCMTLRTRRWHSLEALTKCAIIYFFFSIACNTVGIVGGIFLTCPIALHPVIPSHSLLILWLLASVGTNLILHKTLLLRARSFVSSYIEKRLGMAFSLEIISVLASLSLGCVAVVCYVQSVKNQLVWTSLASLQACCVLSLFLTDLVLSIMVFRALFVAFKNVQSRVMSSTIIPDLLSRALSISKLNVFTVALSVFTTSIFYIIAIVLLVCEALEISSSGLNGALLFAWCVDSLSNDACSIIVGFASVSDALEVMGSAGKADVIGAPLPNASQDMEVPAIGHVVSAVSVSDATGSAPNDINTEQKKIAL